MHGANVWISPLCWLIFCLVETASTDHNSWVQITMNHLKAEGCHFYSSGRNPRSFFPFLQESTKYRGISKKNPSKTNCGCRTTSHDNMELAIHHWIFWVPCHRYPLRLLGWSSWIYVPLRRKSQNLPQGYTLLWSKMAGWKITQREIEKIWVNHQ